MDITTVKIDKDEYIECTKVLEMAPIYSKGSKNTRDLIKNKEIADDMFTFARKNKEGEWTKSAGVSARLDKVFLKKDYLVNVPELQEKNPDIPIVDDNGVMEAPPIIQLTDDEKFKNDTGRIAEIGARGKRTVSEIYFSANDAQKEFELKNLLKVLIDKNTSYEEDIDYKHFIVKKSKNVVEKKSTKKEIFLTYGGMLKVLFASKSGKTKGFIKWATETLFTIQMGTKDQKYTLVEGILGMSMDSLKAALAACTSDVSCIYRFALGTAGELREEMSIPDHIPDNYVIIKFGFTKDLSERMMRHIETFSKIKGTRLELMNYVFIDPKYLSKAEVDIKEFYTTIEKKIDFKIKYVIKDKLKKKKEVDSGDREDYDESKNFRELIAIDPKHEKEIIKQHKYIGSQYSGRVQVLTDTINALQRDVEKEIKEKENIEKICKLELEKKDEQIKVIESEFKIKEGQFKTKEEQFKNQLLTKEIEYLKLSLSLHTKK